jgi:glycine/D-amino acid oxidase-like deaminating enzyme
MKTAVEWYAARIHDIEFKKSVGAISVIEYYEELTKALEQAKEMERQQIIDCCITTTQDVWISAMAAFGQEINFCAEDLEEQKQEAEQYYKETFKQIV